MRERLHARRLGPNRDRLDAHRRLDARPLLRCGRPARSAAGSASPAADFRRARRRLAELPAQSEFRLSLRPLPKGNAQVNVTLLERPLLFAGPWDAGAAGLKALTLREIRLNVASPTGNGELWAVGWRWWQDRPRVSVALTVPAAGGRPGIWRLDGLWEQQAYADRAHVGPSDTARGSLTREERRRTALSYSDWLLPDLRVEIGSALDKWVDRGSYLSVEGSVETRWARDRLAVVGDAQRWMSLQRAAPIGAGGLSLRWSSTGLERCDAWQGCLAMSRTTSDAPLALWSGAGTGSGRAPLLRAHPLLNGGVIAGRAFGRTLVHGTIERQAWPWQLGPVRLGWAVFVDGAKPWGTGRAGRTPLAGGWRHRPPVAESGPEGSAPDRRGPRARPSGFRHIRRLASSMRSRATTQKDRRAAPHAGHSSSRLIRRPR